MLNIKNLFPWFKHNENIIYLDSAATSLKPQVVVDAINYYITCQSTNPHNSDSMFTHKAHGVLSECRSANAKLINADSDEIIFTSGATEALNLIANGISNLINKDDEIVLTYYEHGSNLLPWYKIRDERKAKIIFAQNDKFGLNANDFIKCLSKKTKVVSFIGCSNVLGNIFPIQQIVKAIRKYNPDIMICVDIAQMIPHTKCDVKLWDVDFCAYSGHKIFANTGVGVAYIRKSLQSKLHAFKLGGGMNASLSPDEFTYASDTDKFEGGTPNVSGIYSLLSAIKFLNEIGYDKIHDHEQEIFNLLYDGLKDCKHIKVYNWEAKSSILAFNLNGVYSQDLSSYLGKQNIVVRSGLSCAKLLNHIIHENGLVRASFYVYNTKEDVIQFIEIIKNLTKEKVLNELI